MVSPRRVRPPKLSEAKLLDDKPEREARRLSVPPRKPVAIARRVSLFEREVAVRLAPVAVELLHGAARMLSEGEFVGDLYSGSTMLTIDLATASDRIADPPDASTAQKVALLYAADEHCRARARRVALAEAQRAAGCALAVARVDVETRARGAELHLSLDVEAERRTP